MWRKFPSKFELNHKNTGKYEEIPTAKSKVRSAGNPKASSNTATVRSCVCISIIFRVCLCPCVYCACAIHVYLQIRRKPMKQIFFTAFSCHYCLLSNEYLGTCKISIQFGISRRWISTLHKEKKNLTVRNFTSLGHFHFGLI